MEQKMNLLLATPPEHAYAAAETGYRPVHMAYRIGHGFHLYRSNTEFPVKNGILAVDDIGFTGYGSDAGLAGEIVRECIARGFTGILLDLQEHPKPLMLSFAAKLDEAAGRNELKLYLPPHLASCSKTAVILINTALTAGSLTGRLQEAIDLYGAHRVALEIERIRLDFQLPVSGRSGVSLSAEELEALMRRYRSQPFFSKDLYAYYFTYRKNNDAHFVLYDNAISIKRKLLTAEKMGIHTAFLYYPHVSDLIREL